MRQENPWYKAIGSDFVYEGFLAVRQADPDAILYYNDYNMDQTGKATMVRNMVRDVNDRYQQEYPGETRLLIEGIGMQSHHNTGVTSNSIRNSLNLFRPLGVKISISELDVLGQTYSQFAAIGQGPNRQGSTTVTDQGLQTQARLYGEYFQIFLDNADIIERVTFWGVLDSQSWRSAGLPLLFDPNGKAKPAYYKVIETLEK
jgi:endo-1,4-beta-xylanase